MSNKSCWAILQIARPSEHARGAVWLRSGNALAARAAAGYKPRMNYSSMCLMTHMHVRSGSWLPPAVLSVTALVKRAGSVGARAGSGSLLRPHGHARDATLPGPGFQCHGWPLLHANTQAVTGRCADRRHEVPWAQCACGRLTDTPYGGLLHIYSSRWRAALTTCWSLRGHRYLGFAAACRRPVRRPWCVPVSAAGAGADCPPDGSQSSWAHLVWCWPSQMLVLADLLR